MCNASPQQKAVLNSINSYSVTEINNFIKLHGFELNCLIKFGIKAEKLNEIDIELIKKQVEEENISDTALRTAGMNESRVNEVFGIESIIAPIEEDPFLDVPPSNPITVTSFTETLIQRTIEKRATVLELQDALLNGDITAQLLKDRCFLDDQMIQRISDYRQQQMSAIEFEKLPPLKNDRTDFYFLGMPSAGKSCLIASLLSHWMRKGICNPEVTNQRSVEYLRMLGGGFSRGILPLNNPNLFIDYIELTLSFKETTKSWLGSERQVQYEIPVNILDMAGEKFGRVAEKGREEFNKHKYYLENNNNKALFFVLDYSVDNDGRDAFEQSLALQVVLNNLDDMGILENTDGIYLIVTKADMFPVSFDQYSEYANEYVNKYYGSFKNRLEQLEQTYGFAMEVMPYSIGDCTFGQLLVDYNPDSNKHLKIFPDRLHDRILQHTARYKRGIRGLFSN